MKMSPMIGVLLGASIMSGPAFAESYLCVADVAAGVRDRGPKNITPNTFNHEVIKFVQTNSSGKWVVKELGKDYALFDDCATQYHCTRKDGFAGFFSRQQNGMFTSFTLSGSSTNNSKDAVVAKGRCTKLD